MREAGFYFIFSKTDEGGRFFILFSQKQMREAGFFVLFSQKLMWEAGFFYYYFLKNR